MPNYIEALANAILKSNKTISEISSKSKISRQMIYKILKKQVSAVSTDTIEAICLALEINANSIFKFPEISPVNSQSEENTVRIIGRNGVMKEYKVTEEQRKAFEILLSTTTNDDKLKY